MSSQVRGKNQASWSLNPGLGHWAVLCGRSGNPLIPVKGPQSLFKRTFLMEMEEARGLRNILLTEAGNTEAHRS